MAITLHEARPVRGGQAIAVRPDGSQVAFAAYPTPLFADDGELIGAVNVLVDVRPTRQRAARRARGLQRGQGRLPRARLARAADAGHHDLRQRATAADTRRGARRGRSGIDDRRHRDRCGPAPRHRREPPAPDPPRVGDAARHGAAGPRPRRRADRGVVPGSLSGEPHRLRRAPERGHRRCRRDVSRAAHREPAEQRREVRPRGLADRGASRGRRWRGELRGPRSWHRLRRGSGGPRLRDRSTDPTRLGEPPTASGSASRSRS